MLSKFICLVMTFGAIVSAALATDLFHPGITYHRSPSSGFEPRDRGPVIGDLTGDGLPEVVVVAATIGNSRDQILVFNAENIDPDDPLFRIAPDDLPTGYHIDGTPAIGDIDGDGHNELIACSWEKEEYSFDDGYCPSHPRINGRHWNSWLYVWHFVDDVTPPDYSGTPVADAQLMTPAIADVTGPGTGHPPDGVNDIIFVGASIVEHRHTQENEDNYPYWTNEVSVFRWVTDQCQRDFHHQVGLTCCHPICDDGLLYPVNETTPALGDIDGDGYVDVLALLPGDEFAQADLVIYSYPTGWSDNTLTGKYTLVDGVDSAPQIDDVPTPAPAPVLCDYDNDGQLECVFLVRQDIYGDNPEQIASVEFTGVQPILPIVYTTLQDNRSALGQYALAVTDEGDESSNRMGVFIPAHDNSGNVKFLWREPEFDIWNPGPAVSWPKTVPQASAWFEHAYTPAIAKTLPGTNVELVTQTVNGDNNRLRHLRLDNTLGQADEAWEVAGNRYDNQRFISASSVADLNGDGTAELVTMFGTSFTDAQIHAYEIESCNPELVEWNGYRNGSAHTGLYAQPVTGAQPLPDMTWSGRITVHSTYTVGPSDVLTIKPGTVVEFRPGAKLRVWGELYAQGTATDSIYFKADGSSRWHGIDLLQADQARLDYCVIHGCSTGVYVSESIDDHITHCHIYDVTTTGIEVALAPSATTLFCEENDISGGLYGIRGTSSSGEFRNNHVHDCSRAGIYWYGDANTVPPQFDGNLVEDNTDASGTSGIGGACFTSTTARLTCNVFRNNVPHQVKCDLYADIRMNDAGNGAYNRLERGSSALSCNPQSQGFAPLLWLYRSTPQLSGGCNSFIYEQEGTFAYNKSGCLTCPPINLRQNYYEANGQLARPPGMGNDHFCPNYSFQDVQPLQLDLSCGEEEFQELNGVEELYQSAAAHEDSGEFAEAQALYDAVIAQYDTANEAIWSARGYLRAGLAEALPFLQQHDSLYAVWQDESIALTLRQAGHREAVWSLIAGNAFEDARVELQSFLTAGDEDSLWAEATRALVDFLDQQAGIQSVGNAQPMQSRLQDFHNRLHQLMGRATDEYVLHQAALPKAKDLAVAYPNPFNSTVTIRFEMPNSGKAQLEIFNLLGRKVTTLVNERRDVGIYTQQWSASSVPSGVYFYRFHTGHHLETHKLLLLK
jgi:hypothetical protein